MNTPALRFRVVYFAFAGGYLLSYLYRTVNAVISPELTRELALSPGALGLLTGSYFVAFAAMQTPAGMLLDRYGPRRVEPVLLLVAGSGALAFAFAGGEAALLTARALIGAGVGVCLMAPMKAIATWYPLERQASLGGWMMVAGGLGALAATAPLELALRIASWRAIFVVLAAATWTVALWIWWRVPDTPKPQHAAGFRGQWTGVRSVFANRRFWWIAPLGMFGGGAFMAMQGLWSVPWLIDVNGYDRAAAARHLLVMSVVMLAGYATVGLSATNLAKQGFVVDAAREALGFDAADGLRLACAVVLWADPLAYGWFAYGWRRYAVSPRIVPVQAAG